MKKLIFLLGLSLLSTGMICAQEEQPTTPSQPTDVVWDIMNKNMAESVWNENGNSELNTAWSSYVGAGLKNFPDEYGIVQNEGDDHVNVYKYKTNSTGGYSLNISKGVSVVAGNAYTMEYELRINSVDKEKYPDGDDGYELTAIISRLFKTTCDLQLGYDSEGNGYITLEKTWGNITAENRKSLDIENYHLYRIILSEDAKTFDLYVDGELVYDDASTNSATNASNIMCVGSAAERSRCNFDLKSAKMATGAWIPEPEDDDPTVPTLREEITGNALSVYPTVLHRGGQFTVTTQAENVEVAVFDLSGKQLSTTNGCTVIAPMNSGMYIVKVSADGIMGKELKIVVIE